jgi:hypothetical protein
LPKTAFFDKNLWEYIILTLFMRNITTVG